MSLLNEATLAKLDALAMRNVDRFDAVTRAIAWGQQGERTPPGMVRLTSPQERAVWVNFLRRQAMNEQEGTAPGDTASVVLDSPIMQGAGQPQ